MEDHRTVRGGGVWFWTHKLEFDIRHPCRDVQLSWDESGGEICMGDINFRLDETVGKVYIKRQVEGLSSRTLYPATCNGKMKKNQPRRQMEGVSSEEWKGKKRRRISYIFFEKGDAFLCQMNPIKWLCKDFKFSCDWNSFLWMWRELITRFSNGMSTVTSQYQRSGRDKSLEWVLQYVFFPVPPNSSPVLRGYSTMCPDVIYLWDSIRSHKLST